MKSLKSTLGSFKENELLTTQKLKIKGGIPVEWIELDDDFENGANGDPIDNAGPLGGSSSVATGSSLGNPIIGGNLPPVGGR